MCDSEKAPNQVTLVICMSPSSDGQTRRHALEFATLLAMATLVWFFVSMLRLRDIDMKKGPTENSKNR
jgi:hypothetical protein